MNNLLIRALSGAVFVALIVGSIIISIETFVIVFSLIFILLNLEFFRIFERNKNYLLWIGGILINLSFILILTFKAGYLPFVLLLIIIYLFVLAVSEKVPSIGNFAFSLIYLAMPFFLFFHISVLYSDDRIVLLLAPLLLTWSNDTFAYLVGSWIGKTRFVPNISPKKTWEGVLGGVLFNLLTAYVLSVFYPVFLIAEWLVLALVISIFATMGDLFESKIKRYLNIKDSGSFMPGHGGLLDRFDAFLFVVPVYFVFLKIIS